MRQGILNIFPYFFKNGLTMGEKFENQSMMRQVLK